MKINIKINIIKKNFKHKIKYIKLIKKTIMRNKKIMKLENIWRCIKINNQIDNNKIKNNF